MRVACMGEELLELSRLDLEAGTVAVGVAGDTYDSAVCLTNLGTDALSEAMPRAMAAEGIDTSRVGRHPDRLPGLFAI